MKRALLVLTCLICAPLEGFASIPSTGGGESITHQMTRVIVQLAVILYATWMGGWVAKKVRLPSVVGQIIAGMVVGPFALGGIPIPGFHDGLFPVVAGAVPVSPMLYSLSTIAAIILLFLSGLETDLALFIRYAIKGGIVGVGGVVVSFVSGAWMMAWYLEESFFSPVALFMGTLSVATSIGITASLLSQKRKIDSPEGTVILSAAVIDDILGIIILAVVLGIVTLGEGASVSVGQVAGIVGKALGIWALATVIGIRFARPIGRFLKTSFRDRRVLAIMALGMALLLAGFFELMGLSMIIGAYIMGLTLSNTDLAFLIQDRMRVLHDFFVPIFFAVSGMMVNFSAVANWEVLGFGLLFTLVAVAAKLVGSGGPALALNFTWTGAMRIGWGMVPRGEVALIIASIGVGSGILSQTVFGMALIMTIGTTMIAPLFISRYLDSPKPGQRRELAGSLRKVTVINFQTPEFADLAISRFLVEMDREGFFVSKMEHGEELYQIRKDNVFITLSLSEDGEARFITEEENTALFQTALHESLLKVGEAVAALKGELQPSARAAAVSEAAFATRCGFALGPFLDPRFIVMKLKSVSKEGIIREMVSMVRDVEPEVEQIIKDVLEREHSMSTGMQLGIAMPHARSSALNAMRVIVGLKPEGVDFGSLDGQPSRIFVMVLSPRHAEAPHLQVLSAIATRLNDSSVIASLLAARNPTEVLGIFADRR
jgi:Kef-type K+ transport system membrane component KefB/mannitol/fructose-specific phosphotransferase system IIA component (Ntr-type)